VEGDGKKEWELVPPFQALPSSRFLTHSNISCIQKKITFKKNANKSRKHMAVAVNSNNFSFFVRKNSGS
jgi:hypothetical protein